jgi:hypothetical protein
VPLTERQAHDASVGNVFTETPAPVPGPGTASTWPASPETDSLAKSFVQLQFKGGASAGQAGTNAANTASSAAAFASQAKNKIDAYFDKSNTEYTLPDGSEVRTLPHFRMNSRDKVNGDDGEFFEHQLMRVLKPKDHTLARAIHMVAYGRGTPEQIKVVTRALIDKGGVAAVKKMWEGKGEAEFRSTFPNTAWPLGNADAVKLLQWSTGVGVDCAGYVQQEFLAEHGGSPATYGFQSIGEENLSSLKGNRHFTQTTPADAEIGDLMILDPPAGENVGHTVMIQDHHVMTDAERTNYAGIDSFAKPGDKVQVYVVEASFGFGGNGDPARGGVQRRTFFYNETTKQWADIRRDWDKASVPTVHISSTNGPYDHPLNGIFHPKGK